MTIHSSSKFWDNDVRQAAVELDARFPRSDWTSTYPGHGENSSTGAYAVDFMCGKSDGDKIAEYVWANRKRLGVRYVIWDRRIISETSNQPNRWVRYFGASSSNPSIAHTNHVHVSFYTNAKYVPAIQPVTYYAKEEVKGYSVAGKVKYTRKPGYKLTGVVQTGNEGEKFLVTTSGTWYPLARLTGTKPAPAPVKYLPTYYVDPAKVSTTLAVVDQKTSKVTGGLEPGHPITKALSTKTINGRNWLMDSNGNRYALDYLTTVKPDAEGKAQSR